MNGQDFEERDLEIDDMYKKVVEFEKPYYEQVHLEDDGSVSLIVDKELTSQLSGNELENETSSDPIRYSSYQSLFNNRYKQNFQRNLTALNYRSMEKTIGSNTLQTVITRDRELSSEYLKNIKERDLDNDGIPDRIDIDDTRNSVQTVKDLSAVGNSTNASTERYTKEKEKERKNQERNKDMELEL